MKHLFLTVYSRVLEDSKDFTSRPVLPHYRRLPQKVNHSQTSNYRFNDAKSFYRQMYYERRNFKITEGGLSYLSY